MTRCLNGILSVGDTVVSIPCEEFGGLIGIVTKISTVGSEDRDTENETDDVYVDFRNDYSEDRKKEILKEYQELFRDKNKTWDDIGIDMLIMSPDMLLKLNPDTLSETIYHEMLQSHTAISNWCISELLKIKRIEVESPLGTIFAEAASDPDYPGIYLGITKKIDGLERTYALAETIETKNNSDTSCLRIVVWSADEYADPDHIHPIELNIDHDESTLI